MNLELAKEMATRFKQWGIFSVFTTAEIAQAAGVKEDLLRQWIKRGHIQFRFSDLRPSRPGTGRTMLFNCHELLEVMAFAELARLGLPPNRFAGDAAEIISSTTTHKIMEIAGEWGEWRPDMADYQRYVITFYNPNHNGPDWTIANLPSLPSNSEITTWVAIDTLALARQVLRVLATRGKAGGNHE